MRLFEVIKSSNLENIVVSSLNNIIDGLFNFGDSYRQKLNQLVDYLVEYFINNYKHNIIDILLSDINENKEIKFSIDYNTNENEVRYNYKLVDGKMIVYIRLYINFNTLNDIISKIVRIYMLDRRNVYKVIDKSFIRSFIETQVHELTHIKQYASQIKNNEFSKFHKMTMSQNNKKALIKKKYNDQLHRHFLYPNEMNAYASEISSNLINRFIKEEKEIYNLLFDLDVNLYIKDIKQLSNFILKSIPEVAKKQRYEITHHLDTKLLKTLYKQISINVSEYILRHIKERIED